MHLLDLSKDQALEVINKDKIQLALKIIESTFKYCSDPYIALSFGKDSIVMSHLIHQIKENVECLFLTGDETFLMYDYQELITFYQEVHKWNIKIIKTTPLKDNDFKLDEARSERKKLWFLDDFLKHDGVFMGLRAEESKGRKLTLYSKDNIEFGIYKYTSGLRSGQYRSCPVGNWKESDILLYTRAFDLKLLNVYNIGPGIRTSARIPRESQRANCLFDIKRSNPQNFNKLVSLIPELKNYV